MTSRPWAAIDTARLAATVVLPTPPLPPVTAITLTGRSEFSSASASARSRDSRMSRMGACSAEVAGIVGLVAHGGPPFLQLEGHTHQPRSLLVRRMQVLRTPLSVAHIGYFQPVTQRHRHHRAQTCR